jgi:hypothetical protein
VKRRATGAASWKIALVAVLERPGLLRLDALRGLRPWACAGTVHDRFVRVTEGVVAREELGFPERPVGEAIAFSSAREAVAELLLAGGRMATLRVAWAGPDHSVVELRADGDPLRLGLEWEPVPGERFAGLGARHVLGVDHAGRRIQLAADRAYTGPDCPSDLLELGGIPQGDYAPAAFLQSSAGYALWCETDGNGTRFDLDGPLRVSVRAAAGPLRVHVLTGATPAARLRRYLALTGRPALLPEWGYGFWKSRDVYAHRDDAEEESTAARGTGSRSTRSCSIRRGRRSTTPGIRTPTSSPTSPGWSRGSAPRACGRSCGSHRG